MHGSDLIMVVDDIRDDTLLVNVVDYGAFPEYNSAHFRPVHDMFRIGPELSVRSNRDVPTAPFTDIQ
jgi:hypothetical protein